MYLTDEDFACVKPPPKKARTAIKDPDSERNFKTTSASPNEVADLTSSGSRKRLEKLIFFGKHICDPGPQNHKGYIFGNFIYIYI